MKVKKALKIISNIIFYLLLAFMIYISFVVINASRKEEQPEVFGYKFYVVLTGSMQPDINPGDLIIIKTINSEDIKIGDVITFKNDITNSVITHRVKDILNNNNELKFITQGDANNIEDKNPVNDELVQGRLVKTVPKMGKTMDYMKKNLLPIIIAIIAVFAIIVAILILIDKLKKKGERDIKNS